MSNKEMPKGYVCWNIEGLDMIESDVGKIMVSNEAIIQAIHQNVDVNVKSPEVIAKLTEILQVGSPIGSCYRARGQRDSCRQRVYHPRYDCEHGRHASPHRGRHRRCGIAHRSWRQSWHVARRSSADAVGEACASDASCGVVAVP